MNHDPLLVVNPKIACPTCSALIKESMPKEEREYIRDTCRACAGTGMKPVDLCGLWSPSPGFLVCGGPSLNKLPYQKLRERGIVSLAVNNVAGYAPIAAWVFSDPQSKFHHGLFLDPKVLTFAPIGKLRKTVRAKLPDGSFRSLRVRVRECPGTFGFSRRTTFNASTFLTDTWAHWGRGGKQNEAEKKMAAEMNEGDQQEADPRFTCLCTMLLGIRLLHYLGCPRVYMLGVDFRMTEEEQYSFGQRTGPHNGRYAKENAMLAELKPHFDREGFSLFNCNPESGCDVFPKVSFEQAFEDCKGAVPAEPFDLTEWYSKKIAKEQEELNPDPLKVWRLARMQNEARKKS